MKRWLLSLLLLMGIATSAGSQQSNGTWFPVAGMPYLDVKGYSRTHNGPVKAGVPDQQLEAVLVDWWLRPSYIMFVIGPHHDRYTRAFPFGVLHVRLYESRIWGSYVNPNIPIGIYKINLTEYMGIGYLDPSLKGWKYSVQCYVVYGLAPFEPVPDPYLPWHQRPGQRRWLTYSRVITIQ